MKQGDSFNRGDDILEMGDYLPSVQLGTDEVPVTMVTGMDFVCALMESGGVKVRFDILCDARFPSGMCSLGLNFPGVPQVEKEGGLSCRRPYLLSEEYCCTVLV